MSTIPYNYYQGSYWPTTGQQSYGGTSPWGYGVNTGYGYTDPNAAYYASQGMNPANSYGYGNNSGVYSQPMNMPTAPAPSNAMGMPGMDSFNPQGAQGASDPFGAPTPGGGAPGGAADPGAMNMDEILKQLSGGAGAPGGPQDMAPPAKPAGKKSLLNIKNIGIGGLLAAVGIAAWKMFGGKDKNESSTAELKTNPEHRRILSEEDKNNGISETVFEVDSADKKSKVYIIEDGGVYRVAAPGEIEKIENTKPEVEGAE